MYWIGSCSYGWDWFGCWKYKGGEFYWLGYYLMDVEFDERCKMVQLCYYEFEDGDVRS